MISVTIKIGSTLECLVTVTDNVTGVATDITGAAITAKALLSDGKATQTVKTAAVVITDATAGKFTATFALTDFSLGKWLFQARAVIGAESQVVAEEHIQIDASHV